MQCSGVPWAVAPCPDKLAKYSMLSGKLMAEGCEGKGLLTVAESTPISVDGKAGP
jgi:hypothetical protein